MIVSVTSLECYKCSHVHLIEGKVDVASMRQFVYEDNDNKHCERIEDRNAVDVVTCPTRGDYYCGYVHAHLVTYAHRGEALFRLYIFNAAFKLCFHLYVYVYMCVSMSYRDRLDSMKHFHSYICMCVIRFDGY